MQFKESPTLFAEDAPFWEAARRGQLMLKWCPVCSKHHFYPRPHCPSCGAAVTEWKPASGRGRIYSFTRTARGHGKPLAPAVIELEEGLRVTSVIADADLHSLNIDDEVAVRFGTGPDGAPVLAFTTVAADLARTYSVRALADSRHVRGLENVPPVQPAREAAVVGAGRMGIGITLALLATGLTVYLIDQDDEALKRAHAQVARELEQLQAKGRVDADEAAARLARLHTSTDMASIGGADVVVEAVWEQLVLKQEVFAHIDRHAKAGAVLGTNTSTLDIDRIAEATSRPEAVVGLHFFSPAHVMKLLEVVRGPRTGAAALASAVALAAAMRKVPVVVGICQGFVGNRLMMARERQAGRLLLEGASPQQVDRVLTEFGLPMGTFELQDLTGGIEVNYRRRQESGEKNWLIDRLFELGRTGQRAGRGYYRYEPGKRMPLPDPEVDALIEEAARLEGIARQPLADAAVLERLIYPMINEGARLVEEGVVERASDIDVVWQYGYGWPDWKGGPMYYADQVGLMHVRDRLAALTQNHGEAFRPANLLETLAAAGGRFTEV